MAAVVKLNSHVEDDSLVTREVFGDVWIEDAECTDGYRWQQHRFNHIAQEDGVLDEEDLEDEV